MPRFHFNIYDGVNQPDPVGVDLADWHEARLTAVRLAGDILSDESARIALGEDWRMDVTDDRGMILFRLDFSIVVAPAIYALVPRERRIKADGEPGGAG